MSGVTQRTAGASVGDDGVVSPGALRAGQYAPLQLEEDKDFDDRALAEAQLRLERMTVRRYTRWCVTRQGMLVIAAAFVVIVLGAVFCGWRWGPPDVRGQNLFSEAFGRWFAAMCCSVLATAGATGSLY